jgi:hypothetical protein
MPRSIANGDYGVLNAVESASGPGEWYAVVADRRTAALSCDCPRWIFNATGSRTCKHTDFTLAVVTAHAGAVQAPNGGQSSTDGAPAAEGGEHPFITATRQQWPGLLGAWEIEQAAAAIDGAPYVVVRLTLRTGNGETLTGTVSFAAHHRHTPASMESWVAAWCGYAIAAELAFRAGHRLGALPPRRATAPRTAGTRAARLGFGDILRVGDVRDLGDQLLPEQRAENTLRLFLGEELYLLLERQGYLDVSSVLYPEEERVYRLRRHPHKQREHRVRVFERGEYARDFCIVRAQHVPEADWYLTVFLGLLSDERATIGVVHAHNVFPRCSDDPMPETTPSLWQPRTEILPAAS